MSQSVEASPFVKIFRPSCSVTSSHASWCGHRWSLACSTTCFCVSNAITFLHQLIAHETHAPERTGTQQSLVWLGASYRRLTGLRTPFAPWCYHHRDVGQPEFVPFFAAMYANRKDSR